METLSIIVRGLLLLINWVFGSIVALGVAIWSLLLPFIAMRGDAGGATAFDIVSRLGVFVVGVGYCCWWFLYSTQAMNDPSKSVALPLFWIAPYFLLKWFL